MSLQNTYEKLILNMHYEFVNLSDEHKYATMFERWHYYSLVSWSSDHF